MFTKSNFKRLGHGFFTGPVLAELAGNPLWDHLTFRQDFPASPHRDTKAIIVRGPARIGIEAQESLDAIDYPYDLPCTRATILHALALLPVKEVGRVFVVSLRAGGHIVAHADEGAYAAHYSRMHVSLQSDEGNEFRCGEETIHMLPGTVWTFNHHVEHEVWNRSDRERIHIIIDYKE